MIEIILHYASWILLLAGGFLGITGAIGLLRFPDFYTRVHAASVTDTLCVGFILAGLALQSTDILMMVKAALHGGLEPWKPPTDGGRK